MSCFLTFGDRLFIKPNMNQTPESRLLFRENAGRQVLAKLMKERFIPLSMRRLKAQIEAKSGIEGWKRLVQRETEQRAIEIWQQKQRGS